jgi:hypothetical protein
MCLPYNLELDRAEPRKQDGRPCAKRKPPRAAVLGQCNLIFFQAAQSGMVRVMDSNHERSLRSGPVIVVAMSIALLVGYPLSIGPVAMLYTLTGEPEAFGLAFEVVYGPLGLLPERLSGPILEWANFCLDLVS